MENNNNIFPVFDKILCRYDKERLIKQRSIALWFTGLSGSGKTSIARGVEAMLYKKGFLTQILDGDNVRTGINNNLSFTLEDRRENVRRIAEINKLYLNSGIITINCFISPTEDMRNLAKDIIGEKDFHLVYVNTSLEKCMERDIKGLYKKAKAGLIKNFTGIDNPFEEPKNPSLELKTEEYSLEESIDKVINYIEPKIVY